MGSLSALNTLRKVTSNVNKFIIRFSGLEPDFEKIINVDFIAHLRMFDIFLKTPTPGAMWLFKSLSFH